MLGILMGSSETPLSGQGLGQGGLGREKHGSAADPVMPCPPPPTQPHAHAVREL